MSGTFNLADYATVDERIDKYWAAHPKPEGSIQTEIIWVSEDGNSVAIKATVYLGDRILATGIAQEERLVGLDKWGKPAKGANTSSWWENCETSAIGRALANMGMSLSKRASREEMQKVQRYAEHEEEAPARPASPAAPASAQEHPLLATIRDDEADPRKRRTALHNFLLTAESPEVLDHYLRLSRRGGMPDSDCDAAEKWHIDNRFPRAAPAPAATPPANHAG
jgi:hypothetical protein